MAWEQGDINSDTKTDRMKDNYEISFKTCHLDNRLNLSGKEERRVGGNAEWNCVCQRQSEDERLR